MITGSDEKSCDEEIYGMSIDSILNHINAIRYSVIWRPIRTDHFRLGCICTIAARPAGRDKDYLHSREPVMVNTPILSNCEWAAYADVVEKTSIGLAFAKTIKHSAKTMLKADMAPSLTTMDEMK